jgi:hypothetical protein
VVTPQAQDDRLKKAVGYDAARQLFEALWCPICPRLLGIGDDGVNWDLLQGSS